MALFPNRFMPALRNNSDTLLQTGFGLIGGRTASEQAAMGLQGFAQGRKQTQTMNFLRQNSPELAAAVASGALSGSDAFKMFYQKKLEAEKPKSPIEINGQLVDPATYEVLGDFRTPKQPGEGASELGLNLVWGRNEKGETVAYQPSKAGGLVPVEVGDGVQLSDPYYRARDAASGKVAGTSQGEAVVGLPDAVRKADESISLIDAMIEHPGRETATGKSSILDPRNYMAGTDATDFNVRRKQLEGRAFLEAFESLKGGGQITEVEGQKATQAVARLETAQSDEAYREALIELRQILEVGKQRAVERAGQAVPAGQQGANPYKDKYGLD